MSDTKMTLQAAVAYLQPIVDSAIVGGYAEALGTVMRAAQASLPDRETIAKALWQRRLSGGVAWEKAKRSDIPGLINMVEGTYADATAVLAALSTQPVAGEATSRDGSDCFERTGQHELRSNYAGFHCTCGEWRIGSWNGADEAFAEHVEAAEPAPELAELFPGTLAALDRLSIRPEVQ